MHADQYMFWPEGNASEAKGPVPLRISTEFARAYQAQAHEITDALTAAVTNAQAGLNWLGAQPPDLEGVRKALNSVVDNSKRAGEIVVRLRVLMRESD